MNSISSKSIQTRNKSHNNGYKNSQNTSRSCQKCHIYNNKNHFKGSYFWIYSEKYIKEFTNIHKINKNIIKTKLANKQQASRIQDQQHSRGRGKGHGSNRGNSNDSNVWNDGVFFARANVSLYRSYKDNIWWVNIGSDWSATHDIILFGDKLTPCNKSITNIHGKMSYAQNKGIIYLQILVNDHIMILSLINILYYPQFDINLFSTDIIHNKRTQYSNTHNQFHIIYKKYTVFQIRKLKNIYTLNQPKKPLNRQFNIKTIISKIATDTKY